MASSTEALVRQVARVRRRLFLQTLLHRLVWCWVGALALETVWFLVHPFIFRDAQPELRWYALGGAVSAATALAFVLTSLKAPTPVVAALALDERFQLKERVTTLLTLGPPEADSPAAQALAADAVRRVQPLRVGERFPVRVPWSAALVPACVVALTLLAFFYKPSLNQAQAGGDEPKEQQLANADDLKQKLQKVANKPDGKKVGEKEKSPELQRLEADLDRLARHPLDTKEQARDALKEMTSLEDQIKKREKDLADKKQSLQDQMKQIDRLSKKDKDKKDGPADNLDKALSKADFQRAQDEADRLSKKLKDQEKNREEAEKAKDEVDRLSKKLKDENLSKEEREKLEKERDAAQEKLDRLNDEQPLTKEQQEKLEQQLKDEQDKLERLSRDPKDREDELRQMAEKGEIDQEQLDRELEQLKKDSEQLSEQDKQELRELAKKLGECQQCLKEGKDGEAADKLQELGKQLAKMDGKNEGKDLALKLKQLQDAKKAMAQALDKKGNSPPGNQANPASGKRPEAKDTKTGNEDQHARSQDDKGKLQVLDVVPGQGFKGPRKPAEMTEEIRRASQEAPEAIDRQRLPRSASDMARGFFDKMRGPEKPEK